MTIDMPRDKIRAVYQQGEDAVIKLVESFINQLNVLEERVAKLEGQLSKNSQNSHKPPSSNGFKKVPVNLREKSNRKSGGQIGHKGSNLPMSDSPDTIIDYKIEDKCDCGFNLSDIATVGYERRQEIDIPQKVKPIVTEHRAYKKRCPGCGKIHCGKFPDHVKAAVQYGSNTKAAAIYFNHSQLIPLERTTEIFQTIFSLPISESSLLKFTQQAYEGLEKTDVVIVDTITNASVAHFDESGMYVDKKRGWLNVAGTKLFTRYFYHEKRGKEAMDAAGILPNFTGNAVHDGYKTYFTYVQCNHSLCNVHHGRELVFEVEQCKQVWAGAMKKHLLTIKDEVEKAKENSLEALKKNMLEDFEKRYDEIIEQGYKANPKVEMPKIPGKRGRKAQSSALNLLDRLKKYKAETLRFMHDFNVPYENNQAERDGRMVKLQQKISGCFRTKEGAEKFCRIRSYISTVKKHGHNVFDALQNIFIVNDGTKSLLPTGAEQ